MLFGGWQVSSCVFPGSVLFGGGGEHQCYSRLEVSASVIREAGTSNTEIFEGEN